jgi:glycosyltransferase involved in cell wall biosynthesis
VKFLGFIPPAKLAEAMNASAVFLMMSTSETQSLGTMQAFACGVPAIGANARALPEYIKPDRGIIVEPEDAAGLAGAVLTLFRKPDLAERLGKAASKAAQAFSAPTIAARWEEIYGDAIRGYTQAK